MEPAEILIFKTLEPQQREQVLRLAERIKAPSGTVLFREGDSATTVFVILSGQFGVFKRGPGGHEVELGRPGPGEIIGEMAALARRPRSATVRALTDSELLVLSWAELEQLMLTDGRLATPLLTALCSNMVSRLTLMNERLAQLHVGLLQGLD